MNKIAIIGLISLILAISGCDYEEKQTYSQQHLEEQNRLNELTEEFNKHKETNIQDIVKMTHILDKYNLKTIAISERITILNEYVYAYNLADSHIVDFYNFIIYNEQDLKNLGIDTYYWKTSLKDQRIMRQDTISNMKDHTEMLIQQEQLNAQQEQEVLTILQVLGALL